MLHALSAISGTLRSEVKIIELSARQQRIVAIVRDRGTVTGERIAEELALTRATLRSDLAILTMAGILDARPRVGYFYVGKQTADLWSEVIGKYLVKDYKSIPVVVEEHTTVYDAIVTMFLEDVGTLFVVREKGALIGVASRKDLLKVAIGQSNLHEVPVSLAMTRMPNITTVTLDATMYDAAQKLIAAQVDSLPVVKEGPDQTVEVVGRVTKSTITRLFVELGSMRNV
ncbi:MAG: helix-turn-helix transcriptional regulator [Bacilli bacterium]